LEFSIHDYIYYFIINFTIFMNAYNNFMSSIASTKEIKLNNYKIKNKIEDNVSKKN